jgi:uncharacterized protein YdcH (DUF465 family)
MTNDQAVREVLLQQDEEYRRLSVQHQSYETRLRELTGHPYPTGDDELEKARLKKMKLQVKDQMEGILRRHLTPRLVVSAASAES